jgi:hypothetical protein
MTARAYVQHGGHEITDVNLDKKLTRMSGKHSYWFATGVADEYEYLLTDDEITVQAVQPSSLCDDCDREAQPGNDLCAVHADEVAETDEAYYSWLDLRLGVL